MKVFATLFLCIVAIYGVSGYFCPIELSSQLKIAQSGVKYIVMAYNKNYPIGSATIGSCKVLIFNDLQIRYMSDSGIVPPYIKQETNALHFYFIPSYTIMGRLYYVVYYDDMFIFLRSCSLSIFPFADDEPFIVLKKADASNTLGINIGSSATVPNVPSKIAAFLAINPASVQYVPNVNLCAPIYSAV